MYPKGPLGKPTRKAYLALGYSQRSFHAAGTALGGAVSQARLVIVYFDSQSIPLQVIREWVPPVASTHASRPMSNLLRPHGVPREAYFHADRHRPVTEAVPSSTTCSMPCAVGSWIDTPRGIRKLLPDELAKGLGVPLEWTNSGTPLPARYLNHLVGTHIWESLGAAIEPLLGTRPSPERATASADALSQPLAAPADALYQTLAAPADALSQPLALSLNSTSTSAPADALSQPLAAPADARSQTLALPRPSTTGSTTSTSFAPADARSQTLALPRNCTTSTSAPADALSQTLAAPTDARSQTLVLPRTRSPSASAPADALSQTLAAPADARSQFLVLPRTSTPSTSAPADALSQTLAAPGDALSQTLAPPRSDNTSADLVANAPGEAYSNSPTRLKQAPHPTIFASQPGIWQWTPPDITRGSPWHLARVYTLLEACTRRRSD
jgi:hypothetical protein